MLPLFIVKERLLGGMDGLSIDQKGSFMGLSVELSVANQFRASFPRRCVVSA